MKEIKLAQVQTEQNQDHSTRVDLFKAIEDLLQKPVLSFFTSFNYPVMIEDSDEHILESFLQHMDLSNGLALIINSPGGDPLAAERIIKSCKSYSGSNEYITLVPGKAKSAATMITFGSEEIYMGPSSELGPVDPQVAYRDGRVFAISNIVESYEQLFNKAVAEEGNIEPYIQQLEKYDHREIQEFRNQAKLAEEISISQLSKGMMKSIDEKDIKENINMFLKPDISKSHGRPIYRDEAAQCGLNIKSLNKQDKLWENLFELYIRSNNFVNTQVSKSVENVETSFMAPIPSSNR